jgi:hypothetical protein
MQVSTHLPVGPINPTIEFQLFGTVSNPAGSLTRVNVRPNANPGTTGSLTGTIANVKTSLDKRQAVANLVNAGLSTVVEVTVDAQGKVTDFSSHEGTLSAGAAMSPSAAAG